MAKNTQWILGFLLFFGLSISCSDDCEPVTGTCADTAPTDQPCQAFFQRWFYDESKNRCEQISYSGCEAKGFETQEECESCKCDK
jgi:hypothetical protein